MIDAAEAGILTQLVAGFGLVLSLINYLAGHYASSIVLAVVAFLAYAFAIVEKLS